MTEVGEVALIPTPHPLEKTTMTTIIPSVEIPYGDTTLSLTVGMPQSKSISAAFGGLVPAWQQAVTDMNLEACIKIVALGSGKANADIEATIFEGGLYVLKAPLDRYLNLLATGGREQDAA